MKNFTGENSIIPISKRSMSYVSRKTDQTENEHDNLNLTDTKTKWNTLRMVSVMTVPLVALVSITIVNLIRVQELSSQFDKAKELLGESMVIKDVIGALQRERGMSSLYISSKKNADIGKSYRSFIRETDAFIDVLDEYENAYKVALHVLDLHITLGNIKEVVTLHRNKILHGNLTTDESLSFYSALNKGLIESMAAIIVLPSGDEIWKKYVAMSNLLPVTEAEGMLRALGSSYFIDCNISEENSNMFIELESRARYLTDVAFSYNPHLIEIHRSKMEEVNEMTKNITTMKQQILDKDYVHTCLTAHHDQRVDTGRLWFNAKTEYINKYIETLKHAVDDTVNALGVVGKKTKTEFSIYSTITAVILVGCAIMGVWYTVCINNMTGKISNYAKVMAVRTAELSEEKQRTDRLLYQMLPKTVADQLKENKHVAAEFFDNVTLYFSDIVGFTAISAVCSPQQIILLLNDIYSAADEVIEKYDVYKVETIGDAYMVVSGLPVKNGIDHANQIASMSLQLLEVLTRFVAPHDTNERIKARIGLHSGPVAAGVVGRTMPRYCLFGDTVNTASRMETYGEEYKIHVSEETQSLLLTIGGFLLEKRGNLSVKGKGEMTTYWLKGKVCS